ncbi:MAG TPA: M17 family peptidase N-terminal domain-containing protein, partial [Tepidisphaeraceae bacterium]
MLPTSTNASVTLASAIPANPDAIVVLIHKDVPPAQANAQLLPDADRQAFGRLLDARLVTGKSNELTVQLIDTPKPHRLIVIGLGDARKFSAECLKEAAGTLARAAHKHKLRILAVIPPSLPDTLPGMPEKSQAGPSGPIAIEALATGFLLGSFNYQEYKGTANKKKDDDKPADSRLAILTQSLTGAPKSALDQALRRAIAVADGQNFARTIASRPGNDINPPSLAEVSRKMAKEVGLDCRILDEKQLAALGMGGILAVGAGSSQTPPRLIVLQHRPGGIKAARARAKAGKKQQPLLIVGKAITFDTGGISIKPADKMGRMIFDKCGGMAVLGLMVAVARLNLPITVVGILSSAENHISQTAYRPGDILLMFNGVTVEVTNTDAEGRLVLADALAWGIQTFKPSAVVDLATLTGGVIVALGKTMAGIISNDDA